MKLPEKKITTVKPITLTRISGRFFILQKAIVRRQPQILISESGDGYNFHKSKKKFSISNLIKKSEKLKDLTYIRICESEKIYSAVVMFEDRVYTALSKNGFSWTLQRIIPKKMGSASLLANYTYKEKHIMYWSDQSIHIGFSHNQQIWSLYDDPIYEPLTSQNQSIQLLDSLAGENEIFVPFVVRSHLNDTPYFSLSVAIFSKIDPQKVTWRFNYPIWSIPEELVGKVSYPLAVLNVNNHIFSYWQSSILNHIIVIPHPILDQLLLEHKHSQTAAPVLAKLKKAVHNPILSPDPSSSWESKGVFNPAAIYDEEDKKVHLLYRAVGHAWTSVFGYAVSNDGVTIARKSSCPVYRPRATFEGVSIQPDHNSPYSSGPGVGGCEDPRLTKIGNRVYLTYVAYDGSNGPRVALSSIDYKDFKQNNWNWSDPVLISKPGMVDKNACIFPEKVNGKYVIMHRIFPHILLDYVDTLNFDGNTFLKSEYKISPRIGSWDSRKVGAGPPPIKTDLGWLLIYHAVDDRHDHEYHFGAMMLDKNNPSKVICRSSHPIISPTDWYENEGFKRGVVYPCGAIVRDQILHVYYGGADTYTCVATAPLGEFLESLMLNKESKVSNCYIN